MKTSKSPEKTEITPSKKKLKQARLPFKLISDVSPKPAVAPTRKRKLSAPETEQVTKIGKISKENDLTEEAVIISDDDSKGSEIPAKEEKSMNPFVKLVDTAWKKKLQKGKKKKGGKKNSKNISNGTLDVESGSDSANNKEAETEMMDVDEAPSTEVNGSQSDTEDIEPKKESTKSSPKEKVDETKESKADDEIVILEDSNNPDDIKPTETDTKADVTANNDDDDDDEKETTQDLEDKDVSTVEESTEDSSKSKKQGKKGEQITPKRSSARNKAKTEQNNNSKGSPSSKLNDSVCSNSATPKQTPKTSRSSSVTNSQGDVSLNESTSSVNLTPKQAQKKLEFAKKREEREKEKQEREKKRQQEKEERAKMRQEKEDQKKKEREEKEEAKRKEKEEKEEQKRKEKEERERAKELEKKQREEKEEQKRKEREEKEEQKKKEKEAREEEKRKKQEALELEKQEQELKKKKAAEAFANFFVPKQKSDKEQAAESCISKTSMLSNFMIKNDMRLAPLVRVNLSDDRKEELVNFIKTQKVSEKGLYLKCLKNGTSQPLSSGKTWPLSDKDDDVMIIEDELPMPDDAGEILTCEPAQREKLRPKLLSFHENRRPPYWGTWRKKSANVGPRRPFGQDEKQVDYEADSDEEWEEEQEGESIDGSAAGSDDEQDADEYEVDNAMFVPHGYLSDEEATMDEDEDMLSLSPETQKQRLKHLEDEFESELKKPTEKLKPRMYGLLWETSDGGKPEKCVDALWNYFGKLSMIMNDPTPLLQPASEPEETEKKKVKKKKAPKETTDGEPKPKSPKQEKKKKAKTEEKEKKESKTPKSETKKNVPETKKNQPGINMFLTKLKSP
ncbi:hypothetical protein PYW07_002838 [Mythimna separata]|uniref:Chromatin assembly factor 1 subunit A dimerization domain-containing protein n=1 Tax=Mythimna separata TaxID=271217 RepID=A0AAD7YH38_MYTSE|nr:hypothetical protein PYW07_002838 [Mythimna separata]